MLSTESSKIMLSDAVEGVQTLEQLPPIADVVPADQDSGCTWKMDLNLAAHQLKQLNAMEPLLDALRRIPGAEPHIPRIEAVLYELYFNAVDHGVLGLSSGIKTSAEGFMEFYHRRQDALAHLLKGFVRIHLVYFANINGGSLLISMQDSGNGFDYQRYFGFSSSSVKSAAPLLHGRGLTLAHSLCESLRFFGCGNQVVARISWKTAH